MADLMSARWKVKEAAGDEERMRAARKAVVHCEDCLGERSPVWWTDVAPDSRENNVICGVVFERAVLIAPCVGIQI
ncbi:hypothetical protein [Rhizobium leguminosarum]|uniref:hypothetical protein n=1 Tax=Rhizobium leguminosarum TaxID=384 RepID=UPI0028F42EED|nr:hypothetical protein [Rhizobium leguminosarum]